MNHYKLLTFDIWDTVLRRNSHPDEVKISTVNYLKRNYPELIFHDDNEMNLFRRRQEVEYEIGVLKVKDGFDDEYNIRDVLEKWLIDILSHELPIGRIKSIVEDLYNAELIHETNITYLDPTIVNLLNSHSYDKRMFLSDFYTDSTFITDILKAKGLNEEQGITSMELGYNKRSSNLFKKVHETYYVAPFEHFHIGDNKYSDVQIPAELGISTFHFYNAAEELRREEHNERFNTRIANPELALNILNEKIFSELTVNKSTNNYYKEGVKYGIVFLTFILHILESAHISKEKKVFYLTREGVFFKKIHDLFASLVPSSYDIPQTELLELSRLATFSASLREVSLNEFMRVWNQYSVQSIKALFKTLNIDVGGYSYYFNKHKIDINEPIIYPWQNKLVIELFNDSEFVEKLTLEVKEKKNLLNQYLKDKGISNGEDIFIVDIGWRGTIQDNLAYLMPHSKVKGFYFGLYPFINEQLDNTKKNSFLNIKEMSLIRHVAPLEMLCNAAMGSVTGYEINENNIGVCYDESVKETQVHENFISHFQEGVLDSVKEWSSLIYNQAWTNRELKAYSKILLRKLLTEPSSHLPTAFFSLAHNETFGVGEFVEKRRAFPLKQAVKALVSFEGKKEFVNYLEDSSWPQGLLAYFHLRPLINIYNSRVYFKNEIGD
ncbi:hypothetical protein [Paenibacillus urinalis]|uniref:hypothetical protein n=1 Tax=Paenibacillus urinalis TaxID=521520 RepID=UPI00196130F4